MKTLTIVKAGLGGGAALLLAGFLAAAPAPGRDRRISALQFGCADRGGHGG